MNDIDFYVESLKTKDKILINAVLIKFIISFEKRFIGGIIFTWYMYTIFVIYYTIKSKSSKPHKTLYI